MRTQTLTRRDMWVRMLLYPTHTLPTAAAPVIVAIGWAARTGTLRPGLALLAFFAGWLIQLGGVLTDNYENLTRHPNDREHPELVEGLRSGTLGLRDLRTTIVVSYLLAVLAGLWLFQAAGALVLAIGLASILASWVYSAGPVPLGGLGVADPLFFVFFGPVSVVGSFYVQAVVASESFAAGNLVANLFYAGILGLPVGALTTSILIIDDIRDRDFDVEKGKHTIAVRFGRKWSRVEFVALMTLSYLAPLFFWYTMGRGFWLLLPLLSAPMAISLGRRVLVLDGFSSLVPMTPRAARLLLAYSALLAIGVAAT